MDFLHNIMLLNTVPHFDCIKFVRFAVRISLKCSSVY